MSKRIELKTKPHHGSVTEFIRTMPDSKKKRDAELLLAVMKKATGSRPVMWGAEHYRLW